MIDVDEEVVTVTQMIDYFRRRLTIEERPIRLKNLLRSLQTRNALVCAFLALLEMVRLQAIMLRQEHVFGEIVIKKSSTFGQVMTEQAAVRDDWK
jgi:segregation and condensation protein A